MRPSAFLHQFWHIPFPPPDILRLLPSGTHEALLRGMMGNDLLEFQTDRHVTNFLDCVEEFLGDARVDRCEARVAWGGRVVHAGSFPISIDVRSEERRVGKECRSR